jgi:hypothetical protein
VWSSTHLSSSLGILVIAKKRWRGSHKKKEKTKCKKKGKIKSVFLTNTRLHTRTRYSLTQNVGHVFGKLLPMPQIIRLFGKQGYQNVLYAYSLVLKKGEDHTKKVKPKCKKQSKITLFLRNTKQTADAHKYLHTLTSIDARTIYLYKLLRGIEFKKLIAWVLRLMNSTYVHHCGREHHLPSKNISSFIRHQNVKPRQNSDRVGPGLGSGLKKSRSWKRRFEPKQAWLHDRE